MKYVIRLFRKTFFTALVVSVAFPVLFSIFVDDPHKYMWHGLLGFALGITSYFAFATLSAFLLIYIFIIIDRIWNNR